jgi:hypothetical protein
MKQLMIATTVALILGVSPMAAPAVRAQDDDSVISGTLVKLDLDTLRGLLTTDLGRPVFFDIPKVYLFENVTQGARITLRLDDQGRAINVMDTSIADIVPAVLPKGRPAAQPPAGNPPDGGLLPPLALEGPR